MEDERKLDGRERKRGGNELMEDGRAMEERKDKKGEGIDNEWNMGERKRNRRLREKRNGTKLNGKRKGKCEEYERRAVNGEE